MCLKSEEETGSFSTSAWRHMGCVLREAQLRGRTLGGRLNEAKCPHLVGGERAGSDRGICSLVRGTGL